MCLIKKGGRFRHKKTFPFSDSSEKKPFHDYQKKKKTHTHNQHLHGQKIDLC